MHKTIRFTVTVSLLFWLLIHNGCNNIRQKSGPALFDKEWILTRIIYPDNDTIINFPGELKSITISFKNNGSLVVTGLCNYSYASFSTSDSLISVPDIGPGTKMLCDPFELMQWESTVVNGLKASKSYSLKDVYLHITCIDNSIMVFSDEGKSDRNNQ